MAFRRKALGNMLSRAPKDETASDQAVGGVTAHQTYNRYGP
jgi:hypothetical protein